MRRRKAVSEVVAAMLLVTITVATATLFYIYSSGLMGSLTGAQPQSGQYSNQLSLEFYDWTNPAGGAPGGAPQCPSSCQVLNLTIRNVGSGLAKIAAYYVNGVSATAVGSCTTVGTLQPQKLCSVRLTITGTVTAGTAYLVKITTRDGGVFAYSCVAGQRTGSF